MRRPKFLTPKFIECAIRYVVYFLAVALTPLLAKPIAPLFDWAGYSLMRPMFADIFTVIFWGIEWWIVFAVQKKIKNKKSKQNYIREVGFSFLDGRQENKNLDKESSDAIGLHLVAKGENRPLTKREEKELLYRSEKKSGKVKCREPLPLKNVFLLTLITVACIFTLSAVIGFKVKPFYDLGEKVTGYELCNRSVAIGRNFFKCFWILGIVRACRGMSEELVRTSSLPENKHWAAWFIQVAFLLVFALFDVFTSVMVYPLTVRRLLIGLVYLLFYVAFVPVQALTEGSSVKAFLLIVLIYIF